MNPNERVAAALRLQQPDRVPIIEFLIDEKVARAAVPGCQDMADAMDKLGMDMVSCPPHFDIVEESDDGTFVDEWGVLYGRGPEALAHPLKGPISTMEDARAYQPPDPDAVCRLETLRELVRRYKSRRAICLQHRAAFMWSAYLMGLDNLLASMVADRKLVELVMDKVLEANMKVAQNAIRAGADIVMLGDDFAHNHGPMMSPALFKQLILPRLRKMIAMIHEEGAFCIKHTDGNIYALLDMILDAGPDGLHPIEPVAGMELREVKRLAGHRVCLAGNIDCAHLLPHGSPQEVWEAVRQAIADAAEGGGYMVSSSNSVHSSCKAQNLIAMVEAAKQYGSYGPPE